MTNDERENMITGVNRIYQANLERLGDFERGYAKGYERALTQLVELCEFHLTGSITLIEIMREQADKLRQDVLHGV